MPLPIKNTADTKKESGFLIFIFGATGIGKTHAAANAGDKVLIVDPELTQGTVELNSKNVDVLHISKWMTEEEQKELAAEAEKYDTVVFDSLNELVSLVEDEIRDRGANTSYMTAGVLNMRGHGLKALRITRLLRSVTRTGTNVIITCGESMQEVKDKNGEVISQQIIPLVSRSIMEKITYIAHLSARMMFVRDENGGEWERKLVFDKHAANSNHVKDRFSVAKACEDPDIQKILEKIKNKKHEQRTK